MMSDTVSLTHLINRGDESFTKGSKLYWRQEARKRPLCVGILSNIYNLYPLFDIVDMKDNTLVYRNSVFPKSNYFIYKEKYYLLDVYKFCDTTVFSNITEILNRYYSFLFKYKVLKEPLVITDYTSLIRYFEKEHVSVRSSIDAYQNLKKETEVYFEVLSDCVVPTIVLRFPFKHSKKINLYIKQIEGQYRYIFCIKEHKQANKNTFYAADNLDLLFDRLESHVFSNLFYYEALNTHFNVKCKEDFTEDCLVVLDMLKY